MNITGFNEPQLRALLDLLVLGMYMDGKIARAEEARVQELILAMGYKTEYDRNRLFDEAVTRVRQHADNAPAAQSYTATLAANFPQREQRKQVYDLLNDLVSSDGQVSPEESKFLAVVAGAFQN